MDTWEVAPVPRSQQGDFPTLFQLTAMSFQESFHFLVASWTALCPCRGSCFSSGIRNSPSCTQEWFWRASGPPCDSIFGQLPLHLAAKWFPCYQKSILIYQYKTNRLEHKLEIIFTVWNSSQEFLPSPSPCSYGEIIIIFSVSQSLPAFTLPCAKRTLH